MRWFHVESDGAGPANPCGTGASYPAGWRFLHDEVSGGLLSGGSILKIQSYNGFAANLNNSADGNLNLCYKNGEIDLDAADAFYTGDANVNVLYDQLTTNNLSDNIAGLGYIKSINNLDRGGYRINSIFGALALLKNDDPHTICMVIDSPDLPVVNTPCFNHGYIGNAYFASWSANNVDLIIRQQTPNQGYFYGGLRSAGTKLMILTYDGTSPFIRTGMNLYWNGSLTPETPAGIYNSGSPASRVASQYSFRNWGGTSLIKEIDMFDHALNSTEMQAVIDCYEQKYTWS